MPIDKEEEEGVRAFALNVDAGAGADSSLRPLRVEHAGRMVDVSEIVAEWQEEERTGFRVRLADGSYLLLYYVPEIGIWSGAGFDDTGDGVVRRRHGD